MCKLKKHLLIDGGIITNLCPKFDIPGFPGGSVVKNPPANAGDTGRAGLIPGSGRSPGEGNGSHSSILVWEIPWTEEPGGLRSWGHNELDMT